MSNISNLVRKLLIEKSDPSQILVKSKFFKTGVGEYAENDTFIGVNVPNVRKIAKQFANLTFDVLQTLLESKINEERLLALIILVNQYKKSDITQREKIYQFYLKNIKHVNHRNLVDLNTLSVLIFLVKTKIYYSTSLNPKIFGNDE